MEKYKVFVLLCLLAFPILTIAQIERDGDIQGDGVVDVADIASLIFSKKGGSLSNRASDIRELQSIMARKVLRANISGGVTVLTADDVSIEKGETAQLVVYMDYETTETLVGWNFSLYLPEGIIVPYEYDKKEDEYIFEYEAFGNGYVNSKPIANQIEMRPRADGGYLFTGIDQKDKEPMVSTHGKLITITLKANAQVKDFGRISLIGLSNDSDQGFATFGQGNTIADVEFGINQSPSNDGGEGYSFSNSGNYESSSVYFLTLQNASGASINDTYAATQGAIGAYLGDELRGASEPVYLDGKNGCQAFCLRVWGDSQDPNTVTFRIHDAVKGIEYELGSQSFGQGQDITYGKPSSPVSMTFAPIESIKLPSDNISVTRSGTTNAAVSYLPANHSSLLSTLNTVFTSSDESVFTVSSTGIITGIGNGSATLTANVSSANQLCFKTTATVSVSSNKVANVTFNYVNHTLTMSCATEGATIHYTLDGSNPTTSSPVYSSPLAMTENCTVKAIAVKEYYDNSNVEVFTVEDLSPITVRAVAKEMVYGDAVPELTYTVEGGTLNGKPVLATTATSNSDAGEYDITIAKGTIDYPQLVLVGAKLTVKQAPVSVKAKSYTIVETDPLPTFEAEYSGWKNGQDEGVLTKKPTLSSNVPDSKTPGEYTITVSGAEAKNYSFSYTNGKLTVTPADAITIMANDVSMTYGDDVPELTYTVTGGTVTGMPKLTCEATGTSDAGEYVITVEKGSIDYPNLVLVNGKLTITKANVEVKAKSYTIVETAPLPTFEAEYSGWKNGQDEGVLTKQPALSCNVPSNKAPGEYTITVSGAEAKNYSFTYTNGKLTVTRADAITIKAADASMAYGDNLPSLTYTVTGGTLPKEPKLVCTATKTSDVGTYDITVDVSGIDYPNLVTVPGRLTVTKAPVAVTAKSYTIVETEALPSYQATYSGWKNGQDESVLTKLPALSCNVPSNKAPGEYTITVSGAEAKNYSFTYTNGKLTVTQAPTITVKAVAKEMIYGDKVPELSYTVEGGTLNGTPMLSTMATSTSDVGEYDITIDKGNINYPRLLLQGAKLNIKKATINVNAGTYAMKQNEPRPEFKATYSGWKNNDTEAVLTKTPILSTNAPDDNPPGEYIVTAKDAEAKNYDFKYVSGKLIIYTADAVTIIATDISIAYGDEIPNLTYFITDSAIKGEPTLTCEATMVSDVGEYDIIVEKGTIDYPNLVLINGKLTITKAPVEVTAKSYTINETQELPNFEVDYSGWKNQEDESVLTKKPTITCNVLPNKAPGEYTITAEGAEAKNYSFSYKTGKLTITKANTVTVSFTVNNLMLEITTEPKDATIHYTTDGTTPTANTGNEYKAPLPLASLGNTCTVQVIATREDFNPSDISQFVYRRADYTVAKPTIEENGNMLKISTTTEGASIYYTTNGDTPTEESPLYTEPIPITGNMTIKAFATQEGMFDSDPETYVIGGFKVEEPVMKFDYTTGKLTITCSTDGSTIYYTINGITQEYSDTITLTENSTVKAWATAEGYNNSETVEFTPISDIAINDNGGSVQIGGDVTEEELDFLVNVIGEHVDHLNLENASFKDGVIADETFAGMNMLTIRLPKDISSIGKRLFVGCRRLAAVVWNANTDITASALEGIDNPNLLLYVNSYENSKNAGVPNRIAAGVAEAITLSDPIEQTASRTRASSSTSDCNFFCPIAFTANHISYSHIYTQQTGMDGNCRGWETLALPFDVQQVEHRVKGAVAPFGSSLDAPHFWLYELDGTRFATATEIKANQPYIIAMPQHPDYAAQYCLGGDSITFSAANAAVPVTAPQQATAGAKTLHANFTALATSDDIFAINIGDPYDDTHPEGSIFLSARRAVRPFEAYTTTTASGVRFIELFDDEADGIMEMEYGRLKVGATVYDLQGRKQDSSNGSLRNGLYIIEGKKKIVPKQ